ncbi:hypothetical protein [Streptomyces sp. CA-132043]|uniref:hypothetical protein n=1 Tax=Streptomyces sp. CA-132043 TaxID=3240048 RepID=UPI003D94AC32
MRSAKSTIIAAVAAATLLGGGATAFATSGEGASHASDSAAQQNDGATKQDKKQDKGNKKAHVPKKDGARHLCKHAPKIEKRIDKAVQRLDGSAAKPGSIARLEKRVENAKKAGHDEIATYLGDRLKDRKARVPQLKERKKNLDDVSEWCTKHDNGRDADSGNNVTSSGNNGKNADGES